jgi:hypothetical protein
VIQKGNDGNITVLTEQINCKLSSLSSYKEMYLNYIQCGKKEIEN